MVTKPSNANQNNRNLQAEAEEMATTLPPLLVAAERVAATVSQGVHGRRRVGQGETFWQFRRYEWGDSVQNIDWRQSGKSDPVYVRETEWEAAQTVWLWRDSTASMHYRSDKNLQTKLDRATLLSLALGWLLVRGGERIALLGTGRPPTSGRSSVLAMNSAFEQMAKNADQTAASPLSEQLPRYGRVVLIGDFLNDLDETGNILRNLSAQGIKGHLVQVLDPAEETLPFEGRVRFQGLEGEGDMLVGRVENLKRDYVQAFGIHQWGLLALARSLGWSLMRHRTSEPAEQTLMALYLALAEPVDQGYEHGVQT